MQRPSRLSGWHRCAHCRIVLPSNPALHHSPLLLLLDQLLCSFACLLRMCFSCLPAHLQDAGDYIATAAPPGIVLAVLCKLHQVIQHRHSLYRGESDLVVLRHLVSLGALRLDAWGSLQVEPRPWTAHAGLSCISL